MEPEGSLPHSQEPAAWPYPKPDQSSPCPHSTTWKSILIISAYLRLCLASGFFSSDFRTKPLHAPFLFPIRAKWPSHLLIHLITRITIGEAPHYAVFSSTLLPRPS